MENQKQAECIVHSQGSKKRLKQKYRFYILESRIALGIPEITDDALENDVDVFYKFLNDTVPEGRLDDCYELAMKRKRDRWPLKYIDLLIAWDELNGENIQKEKGACQFCEFAKKSENKEIICPFHKKE